MQYEGLNQSIIDLPGVSNTLDKSNMYVGHISFPRIQNPPHSGTESGKGRPLDWNYDVPSLDTLLLDIFHF